MPVSTHHGRNFSSLNRRYARTLDGRTIRYGARGHDKMKYDVTVNKAQQLADLIAQRRRAGSSKETHLLKLIADQLQKVLGLWRQTIDNGPCFGIKTFGDGVLGDKVDIDICDALDTLTVLEDAAEDMVIPGYVRIVVKKFRSEPCQCRSCAPPPRFLDWLLRCARVYHPNLRPEVFERIFGDLKEEAAET